jgi:AraC-like DNA-binding protein
VLIFLAVGLVLSYIGSKYAYNPIAELRNRVARLNKSYQPAETEDEIDYINACIAYLNQEKEKLNAYIKGKEPTLREGLLQKLLDGNITGGSQARQECEEYRIVYDSCYIVVIIYIEKLYKENRFQSGEDHLISFAVQNVMEELLQLQQLTGYIVGIEQGKNTVLLSLAEDSKEEDAAVIAKKYAVAVIHSLQQYLKFTASAGIGGLYASIANASASYQEAESALLNRLENKADHVYEWKEVKETKQEVFFMYPFELEHAIIRCLEFGDLQEAELQFGKFTEAVMALHSYQAVTQCYLLLLSSLIQSLERHRGGTGELYKTNLFDSIKERQTSEEIQEWFIEILFPMYHDLIVSDKNPMGKVAVQHICRYIKEHISEDLSLVHSSELVGMSTAHISRLFKKELGVNYIEYLTACKLEEAKRLLVETEDQVSEIAKKVGYTDRSLNRVFRAKLDMPPLQYRTKFR